jgi:5-methylcytosine-specific restriction endonuclease McrA
LATTPYSSRAWRAIRKAVLIRDGYRCRIGGPNCKGTATTVDHIVSWQSGGAWFDPANLRAACGPCNYGRTKFVAIDATPGVPSRDW